jgi:CubicO group peptidase (beta-lactamase class C family)
MIRKLALLIALVSVPAAAQSSLTAAQAARIDSIFSKYAASDVPGCALGVSKHDTLILERAWGSADLEHSISITPATIFEAGSVSKQFAAAAIFRLAQQGKLSLDSSVRKYLPELPAYTAPITLRHMIHHTSGFRDWGTVMAIAGWPRGTRTYTHAHVLDIVARQTGLNYPVGAEYLYSNTNYSLLTIIAERLSGKSLAEFTRTELFEPLGMTSTGWRDDYTRVVKGRAQAYAGDGKQWRLNMPFENVYGHSSLLTTVGDLLKWSANLSSRKVGGDDFVKMQLTQGKLSTGRQISYAGGVVIGDYNGAQSIAHDGATAGYRAYLARFPEPGYAIALLCNAGNANPVQLGDAVTAVLLGPEKVAARAGVDTVRLSLTEAKLKPLLGPYRNVRTDEPFDISFENSRLRLGGGPLLVAVSERHFTTPSGRTHLLFGPAAGGKRASIRVWVDDGDTTEYEPMSAPPAKESFGDYAGEYYSAEADASVSMLNESGAVIMFARPSNRAPLRPIYADGFTGLGSFIKFTRKNGKVDGFLVTSGRVRNLRFDRVK